MAIQQPEGGATGEGGAPDANPAQISPAGLSRRKFAKLGAGAGGVLLTVASQPGMAATVCTCPSQSMSEWASQHPKSTLVCNGVSPGYWVQTFHTWPYPCDRKVMTFGQMFPCGGRTEYRDILVQKLLYPQKFDKDSIGRHFAATYLNIQAGRMSFMTIDALQKIWYEWLSTGVYRPSAGVVWNGARLVAYLKSTMS